MSSPEQIAWFVSILGNLELRVEGAIRRLGIKVFALPLLWASTIWLPKGGTAKMWD